MKILITGGLGFQGFHLASHWSERGHDVTVLNTPSDRARDLRLRLPTAVAVIWGSVTDPEIMHKSVAGLAAGDAVVHLAAWTSVDQSFLVPKAVFRVNAEAAYTVLEAMRLKAPEVRFIWASSCEVYGHTAAPVGESAPLRPHSPYAASKVAGERLAYSYAVTFDMPITIVRPCNIYGPHQKSGKDGAVIPTFIEAAGRGPMEITGDGGQRREFLHVADLIRAYDAILSCPALELPRELNIGSGRRLSILEIATMIQASFPNSTIALRRVPGRPGEVRNFELDSGAAHSYLKWSPNVPFEIGLTHLIDWYKEREA